MHRYSLVGIMLQLLLLVYTDLLLAFLVKLSYRLTKIYCFMQRELYPRLVQDVQLMINELGNVTVLWEELWLSTLQDLHTGCLSYFRTFLLIMDPFSLSYVEELMTRFMFEGCISLLHISVPLYCSTRIYY